MKLVMQAVNVLMVNAWKSAFVITIGLMSACANGLVGEEDNIDGHYIILSYADFGPEAEPLLGVHHWQWPDPENRRPVNYDIKVIVYKNVSVGKIKNKFPVNQTSRMDYRYVDYLASREFLERRIEDMYAYLKMPSATDGEDDVVFLNTIILLYKTALKIERALGK